MLTAIPDLNERVQALNPLHSFIVQAPAGSGKTELLTQRFLALLNSVKQPEEILAITFTKKSAAEMRARIINALKKATEAEPTADHAKTTWQLAYRVLQRNQQLQWNLLDNPNRLRIQTIDSFNAYLTKQLPILSHFGATPDITNDPSSLYREAVQEFLSHLEENVDWSDAIARLLMHLDNDLHKVESLLMNMLAKRDQWLPYINLNASEPELRIKLEAHLAAVNSDILQKIVTFFPKYLANELLILADFAAANLKRASNPSSIVNTIGLTALPGTTTKDLPIWLGIVELLMSKEHEWRKRLDKRQGFPAQSDGTNAEEKKSYQDLKQRITALVQKFNEYPALKAAFTELQLAPGLYYEEAQWETLEALHQVLRIVVAQLHLIFQKHSQIDYIESAQAALMALGTDDAPTDMTLAMDYQLQHMLIDEFQDTSHSQFRLIEKLTAGWSNGDGRTLFVVGDPMQSIYRFREAEVSLFIQVRKYGLGHIKLKPLTLTVNFRSTEGVVNWVNEHFKQVFPEHEDIATGAISYNPSIANQTTESTSTLQAVHCHAYHNTDENPQEQGIVELIQRLKAENPEQTIAILVRSRSHLAQLFPALKNAQLAYRAIDIDPLNTKPVIQDLIALTRALLHPGDRIAWLAILRAPWCGLSLNDLLILAGQSSTITLYEQLQNNDLQHTLSDEGKKRLQRIFPILKQKVADRYRYPLRLWIESTWILLGGPACVNLASDLEDAAAYFQLLEDLDQSGKPLDLEALDTKVSQLYAAPNNQADNTLQIMTIHNAKGLEFDTVILPHLQRKSVSDDKQLLLWMERTLNHAEPVLLIAPVQASGRKDDPIYDYIKRQHAEKSNHENGRLLYVAATRAKKQMHLFFSLDTKEENIISKPINSSLLGKLWPAIDNKIQLQTAAAQPTIHPETQVVRMNSRLILDWKNPIHEHQPDISFHNKTSGFQLHNPTPKLQGTLIHLILQQISQRGCEWWQEHSTSSQIQFIEQHLKRLGVMSEHLSDCTQTIISAIQNTLDDERGRWIMQPHTSAKSEWALSGYRNNKFYNVKLDRTFIDENNIRWIIDYKTGSPQEESIPDFLDKEMRKYSQQMLIYAEALGKIEQRPIQCGLYFPLIPAWHEWSICSMMVDATE